MRPFAAAAAAAAAMLAACAEAPPAAEQPALELGRAWARDTAGGTGAAAVYLTIESPAADRLLAAASPVADKTDLMTMTTGADGAMAMRYLEAIPLPAGEPVALAPTGLHVWLAGLAAPLEAGDRFPLTLTFERAGTREVTVEVIAPAAEAPGAGAGAEAGMAM